MFCNDVPKTVNTNEPIAYNNIDIIVGSINCIPNTGKILLETEGYYLILAKIFHVYAVQCALFLNGVVLTGSTVGEAATTSILTIHEILSVKPEDLLPNPDAIHTGVAAVLELRNHTSFIPLQLDGREGSGSEIDQINASMTIVQICDEYRMNEPM